MEGYTACKTAVFQHGTLQFYSFACFKAVGQVTGRPPGVYKKYYQINSLRFLFWDWQKLEWLRKNEPVKQNCNMCMCMCVEMEWVHTYLPHMSCSFVQIMHSFGYIITTPVPRIRATCLTMLHVINFCMYIMYVCKLRHCW